MASKVNAEISCRSLPGAWIETPLQYILSALKASLPSRERGMKLTQSLTIINRDSPVAPFTGAWIETDSGFNYDPISGVAPFTGARIETLIVWAIIGIIKSLP